MGNEYKKIVLLKGLEEISDYHFNIVKSLLAYDLQLTKKMQEECDRIKIADLMEKKFRGAACVDKLIELFKDIKDLKKDITKKLRRAKLKGNELGSITNVMEISKLLHIIIKYVVLHLILKTVSVKKKIYFQKRKNTVKQKPVTKKQKVSQEQRQPPCPSGASTSATIDHPSPPQISSSSSSFISLTENQKQQARVQTATKRNFLQKGPMVVLVLKSIDPFEYESTKGGKNMMFHATVATENKFFQVKVFNTNLKEKFTPRRVTALTDYCECKGVLEINEASSVNEAGPDQMIEVPARIIKRATETPKIDNLQKQATGTLVYGIFILHKKTVNKKITIYEIQYNTGKIDVGNGKWHNIKCEEGDKLRFFCFQLGIIDYKLKLTCGIHSFNQVIKTQKNKTEATNVNLNLELEVTNSIPNQCCDVYSDIVEDEIFI
ncbi:myeloid cell nuclear differentiation antigen-like [Dugong dugon]